MFDDIQRADDLNLLDLQKELSSFSQNSDLEDFTISQYDPNASPVMIVALRNERIENMDELRKVAENYVRNELVRIEGVADVRDESDRQGMRIVFSLFSFAKHWRLCALAVGSLRFSPHPGTHE